MKSVDIFICTKPLQYINLCNIPTDESNSKILIKNNNRVTVLHQDSTAVTPFGNEIKSINVSETPHCEYREIIENLTRLSCLNGKN